MLNHRTKILPPARQYSRIVATCTHAVRTKRTVPATATCFSLMTHIFGTQPRRYSQQPQDRRSPVALYTSRTPRYSGHDNGASIASEIRHLLLTARYDPLRHRALNTMIAVPKQLDYRKVRAYLRQRPGEEQIPRTADPPADRQRHKCDSPPVALTCSCVRRGP